MSKIPAPRGALTAVMAATCLTALAVAAHASTPKPPPPPSVYTSSAQQITASSATLSGSVDSSNQPATYYFQYGTTVGYGSETASASLPPGNSSVHVAVPIAALTAYTTYHFRLVATGPGGTATGQDKTFQTLKIPLALTMTVAPNPVPFGAAVKVEGLLSGTGNAGVQLVLQADPYPYTGFTDVGSPVATDASGQAVFSLVGLAKETKLRIEMLQAPNLTTKPVTEQVAVKVSVHVRRTRRRGFAHVYGTVAPRLHGATVALERLAPSGRFVVVSGTVVRAGRRSRYAHYALIFRARPGVYRVLVHVRGHVYASSTTRPFRIRF